MVSTIAVMHAVEFEEMRVHLGRAEIVDRHEVEILASRFQIGPERQPADPAKSIDGDALLSHFLPYSSFPTPRLPLEPRPLP